VKKNRRGQYACSVRLPRTAPPAHHTTYLAHTPSCYYPSTAYTVLVRTLAFSPAMRTPLCLPARFCLLLPMIASTCYLPQLLLFSALYAFTLRCHATGPALPLLRSATHLTLWAEGCSRSTPRRLLYLSSRARSDITHALYLLPFTQYRYLQHSLHRAPLQCTFAILHRATHGAHAARTHARGTWTEKFTPYRCARGGTSGRCAGIGGRARRVDGSDTTRVRRAYRTLPIPTYLPKPAICIHYFCAITRCGACRIHTPSRVAYLLIND